MRQLRDVRLRRIRGRQRVHHATNVNNKGDSYRLREKRKAGLVRSTLTAPSEL